jgi:hypothetical protein
MMQRAPHPALGAWGALDFNRDMPGTGEEEAGEPGQEAHLMSWNREHARTITVVSLVIAIVFLHYFTFYGLKYYHAASGCYFTFH